jgi:hypothetical protein
MRLQLESYERRSLSMNSMKDIDFPSQRSTRCLTTYNASSSSSGSSRFRRVVFRVKLKSLESIVLINSASGLSFRLSVFRISSKSARMRSGIVPLTRVLCKPPAEPCRAGSQALNAPLTSAGLEKGDDEAVSPCSSPSSTSLRDEGNCAGSP